MSRMQYLNEFSIAITKDLGGQGSGNYGHKGRPGQVGGSDDDGTNAPQSTPYYGHKNRNIDGINWGGRSDTEGYSFSGEGYYGKVYKSTSRKLGKSVWISTFGLNSQNKKVIAGDLPEGYFSSKDLAMTAAEDAYIKWKNSK